MKTKNSKKRTNKRLNIWELLALAGNPDTPIETLTELSKDRRSIIRSEVAKNPNTPDDILKKLAN